MNSGSLSDYSMFTTSNKSTFLETITDGGSTIKGEEILADQSDDDSNADTLTNLTKLI